jgi:hypothetical protein
MIAVVTTNKQEYLDYIEENKLTDVKQVRVLSDVKDEKFSEVIYLKGSCNVTDYVLNRTSVTVGTIGNVASTNEVGEYVNGV